MTNGDPLAEANRAYTLAMAAFDAVINNGDGSFDDDTDFRVEQSPHSGLSFFGSNGRGNSVTVDGGEVNDGTGWSSWRNRTDVLLAALFPLHASSK